MLIGAKNTTTKTTTLTTYNLTLTGEEIVKLICDANGIPADKAKYTATFEVPGGGNWSNCALNLDEFPVTISIHLKEQK